jgi:hypothetical protein
MQLLRYSIHQIFETELSFESTRIKSYPLGDKDVCYPVFLLPIHVNFKALEKAAFMHYLLSEVLSKFQLSTHSVN